jgi:hypothetical protein
MWSTQPHFEFRVTGARHFHNARGAGGSNGRVDIATFKPRNNISTLIRTLIFNLEHQEVQVTTADKRQDTSEYQP